MQLGGRQLSKVAGALLRREHYVAFAGMWEVYDHPLEMLRRYLTHQGSYPFQAGLKTPMGHTDVTLYTFHDVLTVNEIFCRQDYRVPRTVSRVVDFGSNIGLSALYFLTRNEHCRVRLYEPVPENIEKLKLTLKDYEARYVLEPIAVGLSDGDVEFGTEPSGRYGGIGKATGHSVRVPCRRADAVLSEILAEKDFGDIDLLKVDIEGLEAGLVASLSPGVLERVRAIDAEIEGMAPDLPGFKRDRYGPIVRWRRAG